MKRVQTLYVLLLVFLSLWAVVTMLFFTTFERLEYYGLPAYPAVAALVGEQFLSMGLIAELIARTYHESQDKPIYTVKHRISFDDSAH